MSKYYKSQSIKIESTGKKIELLIFQPTLNAKPKDKTPANGHKRLFNKRM